MKAFVASAESAELHVVDLTNPAALSLSSSLDVSGSLAASCVEEDCIYEGMDFGGYGAPCGYAPTVAIVHDVAGWSCCGWFDGPFIQDATMTSGEACQALCEANEDCDYFSFEFECQTTDDGVCDDSLPSVNECYLKSAYSDETAAESGLDSAEDCVYYAVWETGPTHDEHAYDENWRGASGPSACGTFIAESVQSVAVTTISGYPDSIVIAASPNAWTFADGMLAFFNARTHEYLGCGGAGNKPEGISSSHGKVACINEGSAFEDSTKDVAGSMTMCDLGVSAAGGLEVDCTTHIPEEATFADGQWHTPRLFRALKDVRLYGPEANNATMDLEPEGGCFTEDGKYHFTVAQDNNAYLMFDVEGGEYLFMGGFGYKRQTMDASDKDGRINVKSAWGSSNTANYAVHMPDQVACVTIGGTYYFLTANEGGSRDGEDMIGVSDTFEGEEVRTGDLPCSCADCCADGELGRLLTTAFMPSDYATNACGFEFCDAAHLELGLASDFSCLYENADYGGGGAVCGYAPMVAMYVDSMENFAFPGWFDGPTTVDPKLDTSSQATTADPYGAKASAAYCQSLCDANAECERFTFEFELGKYECFLKKAMTTVHEDTGAHCDEYVHYGQHWEDRNWEGWSGPQTSECVSPAPYTTERSDLKNGAPGGAYSVGGRSFTIWEWDGTSDHVVEVFDSGSMMELVTANVAGALCEGCDDASNADRCSTLCPFNSDASPPEMDARSDAKGPEPECVTTGVMSDGRVLAFVGLERTGGIITYDISDPAHATFQDFLNVRNWMAYDDGVPGEDDDGYGEYFQKYMLNDGPESLEFVPAADSPLGVELLLAVAPMSGRLTVYTIGDGALRPDDGSCASVATCQYIAAADGGEGSARDTDPCTICATPQKCVALGCDVEVSKLTFLDDFQVGDWDTDAAEHGSGVGERTRRPFERSWPI